MGFYGGSVLTLRLQWTPESPEGSVRPLQTASRLDTRAEALGGTPPLPHDRRVDRPGISVYNLFHYTRNYNYIEK